MEDLLSKIFDKVAFYENDGIQFGIEYDTQVEELLEPLRATMSESEVEEIKELVYAVLIMQRSTDSCWEYASWRSLCQKLWKQQSSRCYHNYN